MVGYKNARDIEPQIGDKVFCGVSPGWAVVCKIGGNPNSQFINCAFDGELYLNAPSEARLFESVNGYRPAP